MRSDLRRFATLLARGLRLVLAALALGGLIAVADGCAAMQATNAKPVWGTRSDPQFGRCVHVGSWFGTAPGARTLITAHACGLVENGGTPADAAPPSDDASAAE